VPTAADSVAGYGYGYGDGSGYGYGDGYGDGDGSGDGSGYGYGDGYGDGDGSDDGSGYGYGDGYGDGDLIGRVGPHQARVTATPWGPVIRVGCQVRTLAEWRAEWRALAGAEDLNVSETEAEVLFAAAEAAQGRLT
jgi:hypothetical protein